MPKPLSFKKLEKYRNTFSQARLELEKKTLKELQALRKQLREAISSVESWINTLTNGKRNIRPQNRYLIEQMNGETNDFEFEVLARMKEVDEEQRLHSEWEADLLPEQKEEGIPVPNYPMHSSYESDDLISQTDDGWLPVDRWHTGKVGATK